MNVATVRADLAIVAAACGYSSFPYEPADPGGLPAAVVGGISSMVRLNQFVTKLQIGVTFFAALGNDAGKSAAEKIDGTLSVGTGTGFVDHLAAEAAAGHLTAIKVNGWAFVSAGPYTKYELPGAVPALGCTMTIELTG